MAIAADTFLALSVNRLTSAVRYENLYAQFLSVCAPEKLIF
ncbi:hypothetical protein GPB2148_1344 [marine gamma proteobacterium HTCC2148]|nr:hypothetical protein GPB2148_1344 [marine gamma proteobacterium HTCC2148]